ncbi:TIR domain-containing protein [Sphingopyxis sp. OPL5]|uniref:TIR domain-containing protein n=1 Tax=Sphingopyxis sp. OPL5 TaxID=2486273 RepID=UPI00164DAC30|nr:TIR domain-containing protein [Sphingopyxis sp. OPL5]QNO29203.1 TIR domain-containing protein [Sphingopyxis sp. OPL5]
MEEAKRPRLFVSHHSSKYDVALHVEKALARHGVDCWIAPRDIGPGEAFDTAIMKAIRDSEGVLLLFCSQSDKSPHVKRELILADSAHKAIIPLRLEEIVPDDLAYHLASAQWIDWLEKRDDSIARIAVKAHQLAGIGAPGPVPPVPALAATSETADNLHAAILSQAAGQPAAGPASVSVRTLIIGALLIAVALLGAMVFMRGGDERTAAPDTGEATVAPSAKPETPPTPTPAPAEQTASVPALETPPSFNCKYAAARAEKLICGDEELAALDRDLNRAYRQLDRSAGPLRQQIAAEQNGWRIGERDRCNDKACLVDAMQQRIIVLDAQRASLDSEAAQ